MTGISSAVPTPADDPRNEISGRLIIEGDQKQGVYGSYWNVTIMSDDALSPVHGTLSEKVWARLGIPPPDATTNVQVKAIRNANGRWNVTHVDAGPSRLKDTFTTVVQLERASQHVNETNNATNKSMPPPKSGTITGYRFRLHPRGSEPFEARVPARTLEQFNILSLPLNQICDWAREPWGWKLERITDASLSAFFDMPNDAPPLAIGHLSVDWRFDQDVRHLDVEFTTGIAGILLQCRLYAHTLRNAGVRALSATDPLRASLALRDGRWRLAELLEPRPDLAVPAKKEIIYAVKTRLAFREENDFGQLVNWLEIVDDRPGPGITSLSHKMLVEIDEASLKPGARIVCDLVKGKNGWYASRIHRVAD